jgi:hypothetical protein
MTTETTTHTPGPWVLERFQPRTTVTSGDRILPLLVAEIQTGDGEGKANARLIAAAPDLLEALVEVYKWGQRSEHERQQSGPVLKDYLRQATEAAREAIIKATGGAE